MKGNVYKIFQYFVSFMALLCFLVVSSNFLFDENAVLQSVAAIVDVFIAVIIVVFFVHPNC
jgi:hypothetical protein